MLPVGDDVAVKVVDNPEQIVGLLTVIVGVVLIIIVDEAEAEQPVVVPVTV